MVDERRIEEIRVYAKKYRGFEEELQKLWDRVDPCDFRHYIEQLTCKLEDVIAVCRLATIY